MIQRSGDLSSLHLNRKTDNFIVFAACNGADALQVCRDIVNGDAALLTDLCLGDSLNGIELPESVMKEKPGNIVLVMSGFPETEIEAAEKHLPFLRKPFTNEDLTERVRKVLKIPAQSETKPERIS